MKWTFYTVGKDGQTYFPKKTGTSQVELIDAWTLNIHEAFLWDNREDFECLANEYCNAYIVGIVGL